VKRKDEPQLCPDCPFKHWWAEARQNLLDKQRLKTKEEPRNLKVCMELRRIAVTHGKECPYFKDTYFRSDRIPRLEVQVATQARATVKRLDKYV